MGENDHRDRPVSGPGARRPALGGRNTTEISRADDEHRWYWRLRARVMRYIARRYAGTQATARAPAPPTMELPAPPARPIPARLDPAVIEEIRSHVHRIAATNLEVDKTPPPIQRPREFPPLDWPYASLTRRQRRAVWLLVWLPVLVVSAVLYTIAVWGPSWLAGHIELRILMVAGSGFLILLLVLAPMLAAQERRLARLRTAAEKTAKSRKRP